MAYNVRKIEPVDLEGRKIIGVKLPFGGNFSSTYDRGADLRKGSGWNRRSRSRTTIFVPTYQTRDAIKTNLLSYFMTSKGERYLNLSFGNDLLRSLFEHDTPERRQVIIDQTKRDLALWFPKVVVLELTVEPVEENSVQLYLKYAIKEANTIDELVINLAQ